MGGMIAQALTIGHPDRVASLTSIMSNTGDRRNGGLTLRVLFHMARLMAKPAADPIEAGVAGGRIISGPHFDAEDARRLGKEAHDRSYRPEGAARQTLGILASPDRTPGLRDVRVPTLVIHGLRDPLVKPSGGIATANAVPGAKLVMYPDMGHDLPRQRWDDVIPEIVANISRAPLARPAVAAAD
jgi:pimeloyl-ACP methyl ester carboxylesterase